MGYCYCVAALHRTPKFYCLLSRSPRHSDESQVRKNMYIYKPHCQTFLVDYKRKRVDATRKSEKFALHSFLFLKRKMKHELCLVK